MNEIITWSTANSMRACGVILSPEWKYENQELTDTVKKQYQAWIDHSETDQKIFEKAMEQNNQPNPA